MSKALQRRLRFCPPARPRTLSRAVLALVLCLCSCLAAHLPAAQDTQDTPVLTLHVYENLIQIPVLVLGLRRQPLPPIDPTRFAVSIDSGPLTRPTHVRREADDPLALSILIETAGMPTNLQPSLPEAISELAPDSLRPADHVSLYTLNCNLVRSLDDAPADRDHLRHAVATALSAASPAALKSRHERCTTPLHLGDAIALISDQMQSLPGRRVLLALPSRYDRTATRNWADDRRLANRRGVAIFALEPSTYDFGTFTPPLLGYEDPLELLCELSGGLSFAASPESIASKLRLFIELLRNRYIVEFPRGNETVSQSHNIVVSIANMNAFIRPAGAAYSVVDPRVLADPTTLPTDPSRAPQPGPRRILTPPK